MMDSIVLPEFRIARKKKRGASENENKGERRNRKKRKEKWTITHDEKQN